MSKRRYEIKAAMYAVVDDITTIETALVSQEPFELLIYILYNRLQEKYQY